MNNNSISSFKKFYKFAIKIFDMGKEILLDVRKSANIKIDLKKDIVFANQYALEVLGYDVSEFISQRPRIVCNDDMPHIIHDMIGAIIMNFKEGIAVLKHRTKNGDFFWAFTHYKPIYKPDGSFEAFLTRRKPIPNRKVNGEFDNLKAKITKLYTALKEIEELAGYDKAVKYLDGFLEDRGFDTLHDYYMSFFDFDPKELEEYFSINHSTSPKTIKKYFIYDAEIMG
jgi:PAS domain S-box-containing protein